MESGSSSCDEGFVQQTRVSVLYLFCCVCNSYILYFISFSVFLSLSQSFCLFLSLWQRTYECVCFVKLKIQVEFKKKQKKKTGKIKFRDGLSVLLDTYT